MVKEIRRVSAPTLVIGGGGSPCQGLSRLASGREHFNDERSKLFFDLGDRLDELQEICKEMDIKFLGLVENVVMDAKDRDEISYRLGWYPHLCESGDISWVRRPRFYWLSRELPEAPWFEILRGEYAVKVRMFGSLEPFALWVPEGLTWEIDSEAARLPTFTRPIVRRQPPVDPAGLRGASVEARRRWQDDKFRFPPYTYEEKFLLSSPDGRLHKVPATSREVLMGFNREHTKKLDRELFKKASFVDEEDVRMGAIGNSFHTTTVALLMGAILFHMGFLRKCRGPDELLACLVVENEDEPNFGGPEDTDDEQSLAAPSLGELEAQERWDLTEMPQSDLDEAKMHDRAPDG